MMRSSWGPSRERCGASSSIPRKGQTRSRSAPSPHRPAPRGGGAARVAVRASARRGGPRADRARVGCAPCLPSEHSAWLLPTRSPVDGDRPPVVRGAGTAKRCLDVRARVAAGERAARLEFPEVIRSRPPQGTGPARDDAASVLGGDGHQQAAGRRVARWRSAPQSQLDPLHGCRSQLRCGRAVAGRRVQSARAAARAEARSRSARKDLPSVRSRVLAGACSCGPARVGRGHRRWLQRASGALLRLPRPGDGGANRVARSAHGGDPGLEHLPGSGGHGAVCPRVGSSDILPRGAARGRPSTSTRRGRPRTAQRRSQDFVCELAESLWSARARASRG